MGAIWRFIFGAKTSRRIFGSSLSLSLFLPLSTLSLGRKLYNLPDELAVGYLSRLSIRSALFSPRSFFFPFVCLAVFFVFFFAYDPPRAHNSANNGNANGVYSRKQESESVRRIFSDATTMRTMTTMRTTTSLSENPSGKLAIREQY